MACTCGSWESEPFIYWTSEIAHLSASERRARTEMRRHAFLEHGLNGEVEVTMRRLAELPALPFAME